MSSRDSHLYQPRAHNLTNGKEISSSTTLAFTSQLSSLISSSSTTSKPKGSTSSRLKPRKDDIFTKPNRNTAKRAKRDSEDSPHFEQKHTTNGEGLDSGIWERSKRKMEEKARLYAAMKRGDVEDADEKYAVDFDQKWIDAHAGGKDVDEDSDDASEDEDGEMVEYTDEFGRARTGTRAEASRVQRMQRSKADLASDRFTARPSAPANVIRGDHIQHQAFDLDAPIAAQMDELARKRDKSLTPPPEEHFDASKEVRSKGTGFFQFSGDTEERKRQMEGLEAERVETERRRKEREEKVEERKRQVEERRREIRVKQGKRKADEFLADLGVELSNKPMKTGTNVTYKLEEVVEREAQDD
ncbi:hypothetical protein LTR37_006804 [Vermiconidia calcicola]|uniref:Uncharacterized protein n=1 Tax=Vermiconidia calcicola TaxID=1690605 RepID=A0ACC3NF14_9PEZI|nr:hypothetical protein LTR37_006804 [Vermiconidia calcicola]